MQLASFTLLQVVDNIVYCVLISLLPLQLASSFVSDSEETVAPPYQLLTVADSAYIYNRFYFIYYISCILCVLLIYCVLFIYCILSPHAGLVAKVITLTLTLVTHRVLTLGTPLTIDPWLRSWLSPS